LNTSAHTPSVAANESTTVTMSSSGATNARSSTASTTRITASTIGMITTRSRLDASETSRLIALKPPTFASAPGVACTVERGRCTVSYAAGESGAEASVASIRTSPPSTPGGADPDGSPPSPPPPAGRNAASATPGVCFTTDSTWSAAASRTMITAGLPTPAGKCRSSAC